MYQDCALGMKMSHCHTTKEWFATHHTQKPRKQRHRLHDKPKGDPTLAMAPWVPGFHSQVMNSLKNDAEILYSNSKCNDHDLRCRTRSNEKMIL